LIDVEEHESKSLTLPTINMKGELGFWTGTHRTNLRGEEEVEKMGVTKSEADHESPADRGT